MALLALTKGQVLHGIRAIGRLQLHGVTRPITFTLDARWNGPTIDVVGSAPITLRDYRIERHPIRAAGLRHGRKRGRHGGRILVQAPPRRPQCPRPHLAGEPRGPNGRIRLLFRRTRGPKPHPAARRGRNLGSVTSGVTGSNTASTGMPISIRSTGQSTRFESIRTPSSSSTTTIA